ncbi:MAG: GMP synthase (glutamine-hydrolyzing) [Kiloniellales bacterium]
MLYPGLRLGVQVRIRATASGSRDRSDACCCDQGCALRAVASTDGMKSESRLSHHKSLADTACCSLIEVRDTSRVVYNATSKPPRTVDWERGMSLSSQINCLWRGSRVSGSLPKQFLVDFRSSTPCSSPSRRRTSRRPISAICFIRTPRICMR